MIDIGFNNVKHDTIICVCVLEFQFYPPLGNYHISSSFFVSLTLNRFGARFNEIKQKIIVMMIDAGTSSAGVNRYMHKC